MALTSQQQARADARDSSGLGAGDSTLSTKAGDPSAYNPAGIEASDAQIASDFGISQSQLSPALISLYSQQVAARDGGTWGNIVMPILGDLAVAGATAGIGSVAGAALAPALGAVGGSVAGGALAGAGMQAGQAYGSGGNIGKAALSGGLSGAVGGGLVSLAGGAINSATGLGSTVSTGLAGAGVGAAKSALSGGNVGLGALTGGVAGAVQGSGLLGAATTGLTNAGLPSGVSGAVANGGVNYAVGGLTGLAAGALMGSPSQGNNGNMATSTGSALTGSTIPNYIQPTQQGISSPASGISSSTASPSTDASLASTITGALPGVLQGAAGVYGAQNAAQAQQTADNSAINTQQQTMGNIQNIWNTQQQTGQGANTALQSSLGLGGAPADPSNFLNMPGYQFAVSQGTQAIQRQAASMGSAYTPNTAEAVGQYVTGTAAQDYNTYISQLMGAAGLGTTANQGLQTGQQTTGSNISQLQQNIGQAQASGVTGAANAIGGILGGSTGTGLIGAASNLLGSSGNSSGTSGLGGSSNGLTSQFAGTPLANNTGAINTYNANNGPTAGDISNSTSGVGNINTGNIDVGTPSLDMSSVDNSDWSSFLGDGW